MAVCHRPASSSVVVGIARARTWGPELTVSIAEAGGGIAVAGLFAILLGANPFSVGAGLLAWNVAMYALLGLSAGRITFAGWRRRSNWWPSPLLRVGAA